MTRSFILSAGIGDPALADPAMAAQFVIAAEAAGVDLLLLGRHDSLLFDPQVIAAWAAPRVSRLGLVPLVSSRIAHPFHVARSLSAVDYLSGGLLGWCPVAQGGSAAQLADLVRATRALWDGWDDDCLIIDKESGRYLDTTKVRPSNYVGTHYAVRGPVNAMRPKQGHPLLVCDAASPFAAPGIDVVIAAEGQAFPAAARRLLRVDPDVDIAAMAVRFAAGEIDGLHVDLTNPVVELARIGKALAPITQGRPSSGTLRERLGLPLASPPTARNIHEEIA
ncbi:LLM class flavin-dependent oxidoreductase [Novosphingobium sediminicola]|uniref:Alkanesulfonate monooxygenase SsuD/methylene tetrahydromethanopterin reductase-like flavin-dependent oxidoreductase (Luciferase family) n=1 Tax=Novosphingobium sediminicola TaxID=563162 RepID=A0A7W6CGC6_9SPHN|nr:LLM class flavin-dependent oxidoreductase [Novosphingobium sediminicola]MBB3954199.1 alkanesulfonate monooxygenase SsuD/methylene tetrahydromethanopterin reductase-like flavin-dependent oxidoreductase (luciferase family) [Novosphingobium sediminicola]